MDLGAILHFLGLLVTTNHLKSVSLAFDQPTGHGHPAAAPQVPHPCTVAGAVWHPSEGQGRVGSSAQRSTEGGEEGLPWATSGFWGEHWSERPHFLRWGRDMAMKVRVLLAFLGCVASILFDGCFGV